MSAGNECEVSLRSSYGCQVNVRGGKAMKGFCVDQVSAPLAPAARLLRDAALRKGKNVWEGRPAVFIGCRRLPSPSARKRLVAYPKPLAVVSKSAETRCRFFHLRELRLRSDLAFRTSSILSLSLSWSFYHVHAQQKSAPPRATRRCVLATFQQPASSAKRHKPQCIGADGRKALPSCRDSVPLGAVFWAGNAAISNPVALSGP